MSSNVDKAFSSAGHELKDLGTPHEEEDDIMKLKDDVERKRHAVKNRLDALQNLRRAIRDQPERLANGVPNGIPDGF